jgi:hypothetical protein
MQKRIELAVRPENQLYVHVETDKVYPSGSIYYLTIRPSKNTNY